MKGNIPPAIFSLVLASLLTSISVSMVFSISPFFMTSVLGLTMSAMGAIEGLTEGLSQLGKMLSGLISDKIKRKKPVLVFGFFLSAASKPLFIMASGLYMIFASKVIERITNGLIATARDAFVIDNSPRHLKGACLGLILTSKTLGCVLGSAIVSLSLIFTEDYRLILWIGFILAVIAFLVLKYFVNESVPKEVEKERFELKDIIDLSSGYWSIIGIACIFMCARFSDGFMILKLDSIGAHKSLSTGVIGILNVVSTLCCFPVGKLSDNISRPKLLYFSFITLLLSHLCFYFSDSLVVNLIGVMFWGAQRGTSQILFSAIISDEVKPKILGTAIGTYYLITGVISLLSGVIAGHLADINLKYSFLFGTIVSFISLILLVIRNSNIAITR
jgi:MFS family permease